LLLTAGIASADPAPRDPAVPATQPGIALVAQVEVHRVFDERWRQVHDAQRRSVRTQWASAPIAQTFTPEALAQLSLSNGLLHVRTTDLPAAVAVRVAVEGSKAIWTLSRTEGVAGFFGRPALTAFVNIGRYDLDAKDTDFWSTRLMVSNRSLSLFGQSLFGSMSLSQNAGIVHVRVSEYTQWGQAQKMVFVAQASSLTQLRAEHPEQFRLYVLPLLAQFTDPSFLQPGAADVYSAFPEISADQKIAEDLNQLIPQLDADDPIDREAASERLRQLGGPGVLAALRLDETDLSEEQKLRVRSFVSGFRRRPGADPAMERRDVSFLIDCLEFDDPAIRSAAKADLERQAGKPIDVDIALTGAAAAKAADAMRKQFLAPPPPPAIPTTLPAGTPGQNS